MRIGSRIASLLGGSMVVAFAWSASYAACTNPAPSSPADIQSFNSNPQELLQRFGAGGGGLVSAVRNLAVSDPSTAGNLAALAKNASQEQRNGIGTGLAQAAAVCAPRDQPAARSIQEAVLASGNSEMAVAFQAASGDSRTTSIGPGGGGGGSLGGSGLNGIGALSGTVSFTRPAGQLPTPNSPFTFNPGDGTPPTLRPRSAATTPVSP